MSDRCPTCGSDDPTVRKPLSPTVRRQKAHPSSTCTDTFHDPAPSPQEAPLPEEKSCTGGNGSSSSLGCCSGTHGSTSEAPLPEDFAASISAESMALARRHFAEAPLPGAVDAALERADTWLAVGEFDYSERDAYGVIQSDAMEAGFSAEFSGEQMRDYIATERKAREDAEKVAEHLGWVWLAEFYPAATIDDDSEWAEEMVATRLAAAREAVKGATDE